MSHARRTRLGVSRALSLLLVAAPLAAQVDWKRIATSGPPQSLAGYAYDSARDRMVMFGGVNGTRLNNTTWEFDGTTWRQLSPATKPSARFRPAMAYDAARGVVVMFGGRTSWTSTTYVGDTWTWDGKNWKQQSPSASPSPCGGGAAAYDSQRKVVVMFGGFQASGRDTSQLWEWNGTTWQVKIPLGPTPRGAHRMAYDRVRKHTLLHGGFSTQLGQTLDDTWAWNGTTWKQLKTTTNPGSLCDQAMCYDVARNRVVLFGGLRILRSSPRVLGDTWDHDGKDWIRRQVTNTPQARAETHGVYDDKRARVLAYGGQFNNTVQTDTWVLTAKNPASLTPYGSGCAGSAGVPKLSAAPDQLPWLGERFDMLVTDAAKNATAALLLFGFSDKKWGPFNLPFDLAPFGAAGCPLHTAVDLLDVIPLSQGKATIPPTMCNCPPLVGIPMYLQIGVIDPGVSRSLKIALTNGLRIVAGQR